MQETAQIRLVFNTDEIKALNNELERAKELLRQMEQSNTKGTAAQKKEIQKLQKAYDELKATTDKQQKTAQQNSQKSIGYIASLKKELKSLKSQYEQNEKAELSGVAAEKTLKRIQQINKKLAETRKAYKGQKGAIDAAEGSINQMQARLKDLRDSYSQLTEEQRKTDFGQSLAEQSRKLDSEIKEQKRTLRGIATESNIVEGSYRDLNKQLKDARREFKELSGTERKGLKGQKLKKDIQALDEELKKIDSSIGQFQRKVGNYRDALGGIGEAFTGLASGGGGGGLVSLIGGAGIWGAAIAGALELGGALASAVNEYDKIASSVQMLTGAEGSELVSQTAQIEAIGKVYGGTAEEITRAANALSKSEKIPFADALTKLEQGFAAGANANGEYLDSIAEFSVQTSQAGISANELNEILALSAQQGIYSDKGIDAVKEFGVRIREQTKPVRESLEGAFGSSFTEDLFQKINSGAISVGDALSMVSGKLNDTELTAKQSQEVITNVFGGPGEDAGIEFIKTLKDVDGNLSDITATSTDASKAAQRQVAAEREALEARNALFEELRPILNELKVVWANVQTAFFKGIQLLRGPLNVLREQFSFLYNSVKSILTLDFNGLIDAFSNFADSVRNSVFNLRDSVASFFGYITERREQEQAAAEAARQRLEAQRKAEAELKAKETRVNSAISKRAAELQKVAEQRGKILKSIEAEKLARRELAEENIFQSELNFSKEAAREAARKKTLKYFSTLQKKQKIAIESETKEVEKIDLTALSYKQLAAMVARLNRELAETPDELITQKQVEKIEKANKALKELEEFITLRNMKRPVAGEMIPLLDLTGTEIEGKEAPPEELETMEYQPTEPEGIPTREEMFQKSLSLAQSFADARFEIARSNAQRILEMEQRFIEDRYNTEIEQARGNAVLIEQAENKKQNAILNAQREAAKKEKNIKINETIINGLSAGINVMASTPPIAWPYLLPFVIAETGLAVSKMASKSFLNGGEIPAPENYYQNGGAVALDRFRNAGDIFQTGGLLKGPGHASGGVKFTNGGALLEAEGNEYIMSRPATKMFMPELERMNDFANRKAGRYKMGGLIPEFSSPTFAALGMPEMEKMKEERRLQNIENAIKGIAEMKVVNNLQKLNNDLEERERFKRISNQQNIN